MSAILIASGSLIVLVSRECAGDEATNLHGTGIASNAISDDFSAKATTPANAPCTNVVDKLRRIALKENDPTIGFVKNQTCIARKCCADPTIGVPKWINAVVPDFVTPFVEQWGQWKAIIDRCHALPAKLYLRDEICQTDMAMYHIAVDLQEALNKNGCGIHADWGITGNIIGRCVRDGVSPDWGRLMTPVAQECANYVVQLSRDVVRSRCILYRTMKGVPVFGGDFDDAQILVDYSRMSTRFGSKLTP